MRTVPQWRQIGRRTPTGSKTVAKSSPDVTVLDGARGGRAGGLLPDRARDARRRRPAAYREQTVEIALGPKGAFENGNVGTLTRRVPADRVVSAIPPRRGKPRPPREPKTPRVAGLLRKAIEWQALLDSGQAANQAEIARREGVTRARGTQVMGLLRLPPKIREYILSMPDTIRRPTVAERALRPIAQWDVPKAQLAKFSVLIEETTAGPS